MRNLQRSAYALLAIAVPAAFMTYAIGLSRGYAEGFDSRYRAQLGREIVMYRRPFMINLSAAENEDSTLSSR